MAPVWEVRRSARGAIQNLEKKRPYINHYSFHILDPEWGHITIKMAGQPPFGAQVNLNGHEYVACQARKGHLSFTEEGNCFPQLTDTVRLAGIADTLTQDETIGRLIQVCERWIYSTCLCFALDIDDQERTGFRYAYSVYQVEHSRNLLFHMGGQMDRSLNAWWTAPVRSRRATLTDHVRRQATPPSDSKTDQRTSTGGRARDT